MGNSQTIFLVSLLERRFVTAPADSTSVNPTQQMSGSGRRAERCPHPEHPRRGRSLLGTRCPHFSRSKGAGPSTPRLFLSPLAADAMSLTVLSPAGTRSQWDGGGAFDGFLREGLGRAGRGDSAGVSAWHVWGCLWQHGRGGNRRLFLREQAEHGTGAG